MEVIFWGVRAASPSSSSDNRYYGGETACVELALSDDASLVFDGGTGLVTFGKTLRRQKRLHIFVTGSQMACWQGIPLFSPLLQAGWEISLYYPDGLGHLETLLFSGRFFPVTRADVRAGLTLHPLRPGMTVNVEGAVVRAVQGVVAGSSLQYRVDAGGKSFFYAGLSGLVQPGEAAAFAVSDLAVVSPPEEVGDDVPRLEAWAAQTAGLGRQTLLFGHRPGLTDADLASLRQALETRGGEGGAG